MIPAIRYTIPNTVKTAIGKKTTFHLVDVAINKYLEIKERSPPNNNNEAPIWNPIGKNMNRITNMVTPNPDKIPNKYFLNPW